jgi:hypothetical protein
MSKVNKEIVGKRIKEVKEFIFNSEFNTINLPKCVEVAPGHWSDTYKDLDGNPLWMEPRYDLEFTEVPIQDVEDYINDYIHNTYLTNNTFLYNMDMWLPKGTIFKFKDEYDMWYINITEMP